jgi:MATE family multidrug resistance protein
VGLHVTGVGLQTLILIAVTMRTNWDRETSEAHSRIQKWGGPAAVKPLVE